MFLAGDNIHVCAATLNFTNPVATVTFFSGTNVLGTVTNTPYPWMPPGGTFCLTWSNAAAGAYALSAAATDRAGHTVHSAAVNIAVVTNLPPRVNLYHPRDGTVLLGPANVTLLASAYDPDGSVTTVEFFAGTNSLGVVPTPPVIWITNWHGIFPIHPPYSLTWSNVPAGTYVLTALATDNGGATALSAPVHLSVVTNLPPLVRIETPPDGAMFRAPATVGICVGASDPDGTVASVQLFSGTNSLGVLTNPALVTNRWGVESVYCTALSNLTVGAYTFTAVATDNGGASTTSRPVTIQVVTPPAPSVAITSPRNGCTFFGAPANINVCAVERNFTNPVVNVQFYAGTNQIGISTNSPSSCILWSGVPVGTYSLTATATDSTGATLTSPPVSITVTTNRPPPTGLGPGGL
jgi:hypothetical protein